MPNTADPDGPQPRAAGGYAESGGGHTDVLRRAAELALEYLGRLPERPVGARAAGDELRATLGGPLPDRGDDPRKVIEQLAIDADPGIVASAGPRYFGFVVGGSHPVALAADWLVGAWDQNAGLFVAGPAAAVVEEVAGRWLAELFGIGGRPVSAGFTTGATMANLTGLAAGRHHVLAAAGWDVEASGLYGGPELNVVVGGEVHATVGLALQYLGLGRDRVHRVDVDGQGVMRPDALARVLDGLSGPTLVSAQVGNVASGACDPIREIAALTTAGGAWLHVDGAFGLWAAAAPERRHLVDGLELADSWATDAHKWLNVPYDCGVVLCAHPESHAAATGVAAPYLVQSGGLDHDPMGWVPEASRRARGVPVYATLRTLGREGIAELVERCCRQASRMAARLDAHPAVTVLNEVVLNQVAFRCAPAGVSDDVADAATRSVIAAVQGDGTCWLGGTIWHGHAAVRVSFSNWSTSDADVDQSADAILAAVDRITASDSSFSAPGTTAADALRGS